MTVAPFKSAGPGTRWPSVTLDEAGRFTEVADRDGQAVAFTYVAGRLVRVTDRTSRHKTTVRDTTERAARRMGRWGDPAGVVQPPAGRLPASFADGEGNETRLGYDTEGRISEIRDPAGSVTSVETDEVGRIAARRTPGAPRAERYRYDAAGRLSQARRWVPGSSTRRATTPWGA